MKNEKARHPKTITKKKTNNRVSPTGIHQSGDSERIGDITQDSKGALGGRISTLRNLQRKKSQRENSSRDSYFSPKLIEKGIYGSRTLTEKEIKITQLVNKGLTNGDIGLKFGHSEEYIKHKTNLIYMKLGLYSKLQLALWWENNGRKLLNEKKDLHDK